VNLIPRSYISSLRSCFIIISVASGASNVEEVFHDFRVKTVFFSVFVHVIAPCYRCKLVLSDIIE
jgi:hypothetical protein